jgi:hypothetical protein
MLTRVGSFAFALEVHGVELDAVVEGGDDESGAPGVDRAGEAWGRAVLGCGVLLGAGCNVHVVLSVLNRLDGLE